MSGSPSDLTTIAVPTAVDAEVARTDATNNKRTGDQAFGSTDDLSVKTGRGVTLQPGQPQSGDGEDRPVNVAGEKCDLPVESGPVHSADGVAPAVLPVLPPFPVSAVVLPTTDSVTSSEGELATTVTDSGSNDSLQADDSTELTVTNTDDVGEGFRALADLIDTSSKKCTYDAGYVKRQLVYACRTCTLDVLEPAGFCMACAVHCHDEHDVIPLLTRRDFRCDCGNSKFGPRKCQLAQGKESINADNVYNQNFHGKICTCRKALASTGGSATEDEDIVQCRLCEEQFHASHLGVIEEDFGDDWDGELVCHGCLNKYPFLQLYQADLTSPGKPAAAERDCFLASFRAKFGVPEKALKGFVFPAGWWETLCRCTECMEMYSRKEINFILDPEDTFVAYEEREASKDRENVRRASDMTPEEIFTRICDGFDSVTQVELAHCNEDSPNLGL